MTERYRPSADNEPSRRQPDVLARLEQAVGAIHDSETFRAYLDVQSRLHRYSPNNVALILTQRPDSTRVAGYNAWLKMHRFVRRGERGIAIIVPMTKKVVGDDGQEERRRFFGTGHVWDVSQTDGEPLPEVPVPMLEGQEGEPLFRGLSELAVADGLTVENTPPEQLPDARMGDYNREQRLIRVREAPTAQMTKTLAHELAHHFAGHTRSDEESETTAEATAYVVCSHFGLDTGQRSFPYIATWSKDTRVLQQAMTTIQRVSAIMIDRLEPKPADPDELPPIAGGSDEAHQEFLTMQYTLGSDEYASRHGRGARLQALGEELRERYDTYRELRDGGSVAYDIIAGGSPDLQPNELPPEMADFLREQEYACLLWGTEQGSVFVAKATAADIESLRGNVPVHVRHELYDDPRSPVIRTVVTWYDQPASLLALESYTNIGDPLQRQDFADLAARDQLTFLFYDQTLSHRLSKVVRNPDREIISQITTTAAELAARIPAEQLDFDAAKADVMERTTL